MDGDLVCSAACYHQSLLHSLCCDHSKFQLGCVYKLGDAVEALFLCGDTFARWRCTTAVSDSHSFTSNESDARGRLAGLTCKYCNADTVHKWIFYVLPSDASVA